MRKTRAKGPYKGRPDYTLTSKVRMGLRLTEEEEKCRKAYQRNISKRSREARNATVEGRAHQLWYDAKRRAEKDAVPFTITEDLIADKLRAGKCERTGLLFDFKKAESCRVNKHAPSLDRKDPRKGYTEENTRVVVWMYNTAKHDWTDEDLYQFALAVVRKMFVERCREEGYDA
jgi:hypothetical protein